MTNRTGQDIEDTKQLREEQREADEQARLAVQHGAKPAFGTEVPVSSPPEAVRTPFNEGPVRQRQEVPHGNPPKPDKP